LCVGKEVPTEKAISRMAIGQIKPQEDDDEDCIIEGAAALPPAAHPGESGQKPGDSGFSGNSGDESGDSGPAAEV
jgi:hypothetical protein